MKFHKKKEIDNEEIAMQYLRSLDNKAYKQFLKVIEIYRNGDVELDKFKGKNVLNDTPDFME